MHPDAIAKAWRRFHEAQSALNFIGILMGYEGFESHWSEFLGAGNGVHLALEKGAKDSPQSRQWFGAKKRERRMDPLLNYMFQARNADEHGIRPVAARGRAPRGKEPFERGVLVGETFRIREGIFGYFSTTNQAAELCQITPPDVELVPVHHDQFNQIFDPPTEHLGRPLKSQTPLTVGKVWLVYLRRLIREAETLTSSPPSVRSP